MAPGSEVISPAFIVAVHRGKTLRIQTQQSSLSKQMFDVLVSAGVQGNLCLESASLRGISRLFGRFMCVISEAEH